MTWESVVLTHLGMRRTRNEDSHLFRPEWGLFAVADGMGGHAAGDVASRMAVASVDVYFREHGPPRDRGEVEHMLVEAAARASREIVQRAVVEPDKHGMGTTLTVLATGAEDCIIAHIGDSRAYRLHDGELRQLTTDHTWVQRQVAVGALSPVEARGHPYSSVLTRVLGMPDVGEADLVEADAAAGDTFLLCSDGLTSMVDDADLEAMLMQVKPLAEIAHDLIEAANLRGGYDNVTVILLRPVG